jgi:glutamine cyclotransferase
VLGLNDLTYAGGIIWANIIGTHLLAGIDPASGEVSDVVDARAARERQVRDQQAIMNGVAALPRYGEFLLTGKTYRHIGHVRLVPGRTLAGRLTPGSLSLTPNLDGLSV